MTLDKRYKNNFMITKIQIMSNIELYMYTNNKPDT